AAGTANQVSTAVSRLPAGGLWSTARLRWGRRARTVTAVLAVGVAAGGLVAAEMRTSLFSALLLPPLARGMTSTMAPGPSPDAVRAAGPYDRRLGYADLPRFIDALRARGWMVSAQARPSPSLLAWTRAGGYAIYSEKTSTGLRLLDRNGAPLYETHFPQQAFGSPDAIPPLLVRTLLQIEDQHLLDPERPRRNPAVDWPRFLRAIAGQVLRAGGSHVNEGGGSTLATQIEKFRHSPEGRTEGYAEKLRQMASASLRAYAGGGDTTAARRRLVATYLDSVPLASRPGYGEVIGLGDGLWANYGMDLRQVREDLEIPEDDAARRARLADTYKHVLSLLLAERRPSFYLNARHDRLETLTDGYLRLLCAQGVIGPQLRDAALQVQLRFLPEAPPPQAVDYAGRKSVDVLRRELLAQLSVPGYNSLDRLDLSVRSTIDQQAQRRVAATLQRLSDPAYAASLGLVGTELLPAKGLDHVVYSVLLYERGASANALRVHADSLDQPFDINSGAKLMLGSTAKLRTLITYLDIVVELRERLRQRPRAELAALARHADDPLTQWAAGYLGHAPDAALRPMLDAAMLRRYSASPHRSFFTGGGAHVFHNFKKFEDAENPTVQDALERSINLAFIRLMRDITRYYIAQEGDTVRRLLADSDDPARQDYLRQFADQEGRQYLGRYYEDYAGLAPRDALEQLADHARQNPQALVTVFLATRPEASPQELAQFLKERLPGHLPAPRKLASLYAECQSGRLTLSDQGYLAGVHPLEIWLVGWLRNHPDASRTDTLRAGTLARQQAYDWLFRTRHPERQNERIGILLEQLAFERIADDWHRQGYPFRQLVPSLATAIGSSGDRPDALADLVGIIAAGGQRLPAVDTTALRFAAGTPYQTELQRTPAAAERVLDPEVADVVRGALQGVVERGTAQRLKGGYTAADGTPLFAGGKTGTGDNRYETYGSGHRLLQSTAVNRSATFAFMLGERWFGVVTVYVPGKQADRFHFTSALAVQLLRALQPALGSVITAAEPDAPERQAAARRAADPPRA
ncbi:MAG TPA: transglycosylase domain-containing protein, partial [Nevskia sp.]|nr:transglycosylase domain-containing protein [Nevskia sp.]